MQFEYAYNIENIKVPLGDWLNLFGNRVTAFQYAQLIANPTVKVLYIFQSGHNLKLTS